MVPLLILQLILGFWAAELPIGFERFFWLSRHKSLGMLLLFLLLLRMFWRFIHKMSFLLQSMSPLQKRAVTIVHLSLYACMLLMPLSGWLMASAAKLPPGFFGLISFPALIEPDNSLKDIFNQFHTFLVWLFCFLITIHIMAAFYHQLIIKDNVINRIKFGSRE